MKKKKTRRGLVMIKNLMGNFTKEVRFSFLRNKNMLKCGRKYTKQTVNKYRRLLVRNFVFFFSFFFHFAIQFLFFCSRLVAEFSAQCNTSREIQVLFLFYNLSRGNHSLCINNDKTTHIFYLYTYSCSFVFRLSERRIFGLYTCAVGCSVSTWVL